MPTVFGYHDVKDTDHWLASPKREEFFGPKGGRRAVRLDEVTAASFLDYRAFRRTANHRPTGTQKAVSAANRPAESPENARAVPSGTALPLAADIYG